MSVTFTRVETVPANARVHHIDELSGEQQQALHQLVEDKGIPSPDPDVAAELTQYDIVKYTDYYRIDSIGIVGANQPSQSRAVSQRE